MADDLANPQEIAEIEALAQKLVEVVHGTTIGKGMTAFARALSRIIIFDTNDPNKIMHRIQLVDQTLQTLVVAALRDRAAAHETKAKHDLSKLEPVGSA